MDGKGVDMFSSRMGHKSTCVSLGGGCDGCEEGEDDGERYGMGSFEALKGTGRVGLYNSEGDVDEGRGLGSRSRRV
jgi:hypothetical protein